jgi:Ca-activated chloride channel family protein
MKTRLLSTMIYVGMVVVAYSQVDSQSNTLYSMKVHVDEVELTLHATDAQGASVNDLRLEELKIFDNNRLPSRIVAFKAMRDLPIRAGILIDTSSSMESSREAIQSIAIAYAQQILKQKTDQAFVASFGKRLQAPQFWSNDPTVLTTAISRVGNNPSATAIYDAVYAICRYQFGKFPNDSSGNFIMLFSDGEDDASYLSLQAAVDMCQQTNTAIYAFRPQSASVGLSNLSQLASLTGGQVFRDGASSAELHEDLRIIEANLRNQYRIIYNPGELKHDGLFHRIVILPPDRVANISVRSGYYAPSR